MGMVERDVNEQEKRRRMGKGRTDGRKGGGRGFSEV